MFETQRDLKPQNLLLSDTGPLPFLKIADFGFARPLQVRLRLHGPVPCALHVPACATHDGVRGGTARATVSEMQRMVAYANA